MASRGTRTRVTPVPQAVIDEVAEKAAIERAAKAALATFAGEIDLAQSEVKPQGLAQKLHYIMSTIGNMEKEGENKFHHYKYWSDDQISAFFRKLFVEVGILFGIDLESYELKEHETKSEGRSILTTGVFSFTFTDVETGETLTKRMFGQGDDPTDKGSNKAATGATKYFLLKFFLIGGEDAEADEKTDRRNTRSRNDKPVRIGKSEITGIQRGGRSSKATDVQVRQVAQLSVDLGWKDIAGIAKRLSEWLNEEVDLSETPPEDQAESLRKWLESLSGDDIATLINKMVELRDSEDAPPADDREEEAGGGYDG